MNSRKILIIDDERTLRRVVGTVLAREGYEPLEAETGEEGVAMALEQAPCLILCDIKMPGLDGFETLNLLQENARTAQIPFIFLTAVSDRSFLRKGMDVGADDYLTKPINRQELLNAVRIRLAKREQMEKIHTEKLEELRGRIMYALPHELRTPLSSIIALSSLLSENAGTLERNRIHEVGENLQEVGHRLLALVENYLIYAQIELLASEPGHLEALRLERVTAPSEVIKPTAKETAVTAGRADDIQFNFVNDVCVAVSEKNLTKITQELTENALKFSSEGTPVAISTRVTEASFCLEITDRGRGMAAQDILQIGAFNQFQREMYEQQGSGLGMVISKRLVELHEGDFSVESEPGEGTSVLVSLPRGQPHCSPKAIPDHS